jgi:hypothetical protein
MSTHSIHEDVHTHGLADGCPRCAEHAENPLRDLDDDVVRGLMERVVSEESPRSDSERLAMHNVRIALGQACYLARLNPILFAKYAKTQHGVHLIAVIR